MYGATPYGVNPYTTSTIGVPAAGIRRSLNSSAFVAPPTATYGAPAFTSGAPFGAQSTVVAAPFTPVGPVAPVVGTSTLLPRTSTLAQSTVVPGSFTHGPSVIDQHTPALYEKLHYDRSVYNVHPPIPRGAQKRLNPSINEVVSNSRTYTTSYPVGVDATFLQKQALTHNHAVANRPRWTRPVVPITPPIPVGQTTTVTNVTTPHTYAATTAVPVTTPGAVIQQPALQQSFAYPANQSMVYPGTVGPRISQAYY